MQVSVQPILCSLLSPTVFASDGVLDDEDLKLGTIPSGAIGTAAIYTESVTATHIIRKVMVRMETWMNYLKP